MGAVNSTGKLDRALAADLPEDERYFGLENFGNTCYCNSVLQALYFCEPFRKAVLDYEKHRTQQRYLANAALSAVNGANSISAGGILKKAVGMGTSVNGTASDTAGTGNNGNNSNSNSNNDSSASYAGVNEETMLTALSELFHQISSHKKRTGSVPPKSFVSKLRQQNELFSSYMHQDAHEFLNFILNDIVECLRKEAARNPNNNHRLEIGGNGTIANGHMNGHGGSIGISGNKKNVNEPQEEQEPPRTFVHDLFEGKLSNEVRCLCCETVTQRIESFFDLSVDVEQNSSLTACLRNFSSTELLREQDKFYCDMCCSLQEAERRMRVKILPQILSLHLKRFKFMEQFKKYKKLSYRVVFPLELRLCNTSDDAEDPDRLYSLFAVVVHVGSGPNQGHYVSLIKSHGQWLLFDDDCVEVKAESELQSVFGMTQDGAQSTEAGYILFYEQISSNT